MTPLPVRPVVTSTYLAEPSSTIKTYWVPFLVRMASVGTTTAFSEVSVWNVTSANIPDISPPTSAGTVSVTVYSLVCMLAACSTERMTAVKDWLAALTVTSAVSPMRSLGTRASDTETVTFIRSAPSMTARGMALEIKLFSTVFMLTRVPSMGAVTLPSLSTFSRAVFSCATELLALWMPASSWDRAESRPATAF